MCVNSGLDALQIHDVMHFYCTRWCCRANRQISTVVSDTCPDLKLVYWLCPWDERNTNCCSFCFCPAAAATACYGPIRARSGGAHTLWGWSTLLQGAILSSSIRDLNYPSPRPILLFLGVSSFISTLLCH